jgi:hypothetical protein
VVRAFVRLRALAAAHQELLDALEAKYDEQFPWCSTRFVN